MVHMQTWGDHSAIVCVCVIPVHLQVCVCVFVHVIPVHLQVCVCVYVCVCM